MLAALLHVTKTRNFKAEAEAEIEKVIGHFKTYTKANIDSDFKKEHLEPLEGILAAVKTSQV